MEAANLALSIMALFLVLAVFKAGRIAAAIWFGVTFPNAGRKVLHAHTANPGKCMLLGMGGSVLALLVVAILLKTKLLGWLGLLVLLCFVCVCVLAYAPTYYRYGKRLETGGARSVVGTVFRGGLLAESLFLAPVLGQVLSLLALFRGLGAVYYALVIRRKPPVE